MNILVTGSTGFIGTHFMKKFNKKFNILHELSRNQKRNKSRSIELFQEEKLKEIFLKQKYDVVIHLGTTIKEKNRIQMLKENCNTTENLLKCCVENNVKKFILTSSGMVYGNTEYLPIDEIHPKKTKTNYGYSKIINEEKCKTYSKKYGIEIVILRVSSVYGPGQNEKFVIPTLIKNAVKNKVITLHRYQNGFQLMDYVHVDDVCNAVIASCRSKVKCGIYNIASGKPITVLDIGQILKKILKIRRIIVKEMKSNTEHYFYDISLAKKKLKFQPKKKIDRKTMAKIIQYYNYKP